MVISVDETKNTPIVSEDSDCSSMHIIFVLDETGSMESNKEATISGFNEYVQTMKAKSPGARFTLIMFNSADGIRSVPTASVQNVQELSNDSYHPNGRTPLYDAVSSAIGCGTAHPAEKTLIVIQTDGEENASTEMTADRICDLIKEKEAKGWTFVCMGADLDAWAKVGSSLGLAQGNVMSYQGSNSLSAFQNLSRATATYGCNMNKSSVKSFWSGQ